MDESDGSFIPLMLSIVQTCPLIQELEIMGPNYEDGILSVDTRELAAIAQLTQLKRLTLSELSVNNGNFLEKVIIRSFFYKIYII